MTVLFALFGLALWASLATVVAIARDGYRQMPTITNYESSPSA